MTLWWALGRSQGGETNWRSLKSSDKNSSYILRGRVDREYSLRLGDGAEDRRSGIFQRLDRYSVRRNMEERPYGKKSHLQSPELENLIIKTG